MAGESTGGKRSMMASVAIISFAIGLSAAAWSLVDDAPVTYAGLFSEPVMDLVLEHEGRIDGFVGNTNLAPGDRIGGTLRVLVDGATPTRLQDLDFDVWLYQGDAPVEHATDWADALLVSRLSYGRDNLLSGEDGGRNLLLEIDANPLLGNGDGRLSIGELRAGVNDLPPPSTRAEGGTGFTIELRVDPTKTNLPPESLRTNFVFRIGDRADADLN